jgi:hypothetical protein
MQTLPMTRRGKRKDSSEERQKQNVDDKQKSDGERQRVKNTGEHQPREKERTSGEETKQG